MQALERTTAAAVVERMLDGFWNRLNASLLPPTRPWGCEIDGLTWAFVCLL
jgi:hypothetical protein